MTGRLLSNSITAAVFSGEIVQLRLQLRCNAVARRCERVGELRGSAGAEGDRRDRRVWHDPGDGQFREGLAPVPGDRTELLDRLERASMPVARLIHGAEPADSRREAARVRYLVM